MDFQIQDSLFRLRGPRIPSEEVVIIAIDDASFSALNISWPFPRGLHAKLIENLSLAGAKLIVFDLEFTEKILSKRNSIAKGLFDKILSENEFLAEDEIGLILDTVYKNYKEHYEANFDKLIGG